MLFNKSFRSGIFPEMWKEANIHPIYKKKGSQSDPTNYRPISLLSTLSKIMGKNVLKNIYGHLSEHQLLSEKKTEWVPDKTQYTTSTHLSLS